MAQSRKLYEVSPGKQIKIQAKSSSHLDFAAAVTMSLTCTAVTEYESEKPQGRLGFLVLIDVTTKQNHGS